MAVNHYFKVFSNDGSTTLFTSANTVNNSTIITVTETGLTIGIETYTYSGTKKFVGVSGSASSTSPDCAIGESFGGGWDSVYIVEAEPATSAVTVEYNGLVIATIPNGKMATVSCNGKKMTTDVIIEVPMATDSPIPTEVSTEAEMTALLTSGEVGGVYKYTGTTGTYENGALYVLEEEATEDELAGTWVLNGLPCGILNTAGVAYVNFKISGGDSFTNLNGTDIDDICELYFDSTPAYYGTYGSYDTVHNELFKTITFTSTLAEVDEVQGQLILDWLKRNFTKQ